MASTYSLRFRLNLQAPGDNLNTWGTICNTAVFQLLEDAIARRVALTVSGAVTLTSANGATDQARCAFLDVTAGAGGTITAPSVEKLYVVRNAASGDVILTTGSGATATFKAGELGWAAGDGTNFYKELLTDFGGAALTSVGQVNGLTDPSSAQQAATKNYVDTLVSNTAFALLSGYLPVQGGAAGKFLTTNGAVASWGVVVPFSRLIVGGGLATGGGDLTADRTITVTAAAAADVRAGSDTTKALTASALMASSVFQTLTDASTISWNCASGYNAAVTLTASGHTVGVPTNLYDGLSISLDIIQDATGSRTVNWNGVWDFGAAGLPLLQTPATKADRVFGQYNARTSKIEASYRKGT